jgi:hypothetical protein
MEYLPIFFLKDFIDPATVRSIQVLEYQRRNGDLETWLPPLVVLAING